MWFAGLPLLPLWAEGGEGKATEEEMIMAEMSGTGHRDIELSLPLLKGRPAVEG